MKAFFISNLYPPYFLGGYEVACRDVAEQFFAQGHNVSVLCSSYGLNKPARRNSIYRFLDVRTDFNGFKSIREKALSLFYNPENYKKTIQLISEIKPDVASVWNINGISIAPLFALQKCKIPYVIHLFDRSFSFLKKNGLKRIINPLLYDRLRASYFISCSASLKEDYVKKGFNADCIQVIPHGIVPQSSLPDRLERKGSALKLLFVGQLWEAKGADLAIKSVALLKKKKVNAALTVIGDGKKDYKRILTRLTEQLGVKNDVEFLGRMPRIRITKFYQTHDIFLFPTYDWYREPFGIVILEAMNQGIPVIASNCSGPKEIIIDGKNGLLFEPGDADSLTDRVIELTENAELYSRTRKNALMSVQNEFNIIAIGNQILELYNQRVLR